VPLSEWFATHGNWPDAVLPAYDDGSVANLAAAIVAGFGGAISATHLLPPVRAAILPANILQNARVVALIVLDGLSASAYRRAAVAGRARGLRSLAVQSELTSVFPTTTTAALTSVQVGVAPARHGVVGYTIYFPALNRVVNMIHFTPVDGGAFRGAPPDPTTLLPVPRIYDVLAGIGVESVVVSHAQYADSPLTRLHMGNVRYEGHRTPAEFAWLLKREIERPGRRFVFGYWAGIDMLGHVAGPSSSLDDLELQVIDRALQAGLFEPLADTSEDVAVLVTADHGLVDLDPERVIRLSGLRERVGGLRHPPTGERRAIGLALKHSERRAEIAELVGDAGSVLPVNEVVEAGLYGPPPHHSELMNRIGDTLVLAKDGAWFPYRPARNSEQPMLGSHGSLTPQEMLVPLLAQRFGA
jgi:hypothetical protein